MYNFYEQCIVGDTADNVNYFKGKGKKCLQKSILKTAQQNTNTQESYMNYLNKNTKVKQDKNTQSAITF